MTTKDPSLSNKDIWNHISSKLDEYDKLSFPEQYAMFMSKVQFLENGLKKILLKKFNFEYEKIEKWSLGRVIRELDDCGLRKDYIALLEVFLEYRNYMAHDLLMDDLITRSLTEGNSMRSVIRHFEHGVFYLEQLLLLYEWTEQHDAWI